MFLVRKISRAKWEKKSHLHAEEISADAVTVDLRTMDDSLSFWRCSSDSTGDVEDVVLALASIRDSVDRIDIVWIAEEDLQSAGQNMKNTDGRTPVGELVNRHVELYWLDYVRLGKVADCVVTAITNNQCRRVSKKRVTELLKDAISQSRISLDDLSKNIQDTIR